MSGADRSRHELHTHNSTTCPAHTDALEGRTEDGTRLRHPRQASGAPLGRWRGRRVVLRSRVRRWTRQPAGRKADAPKHTVQRTPSSTAHRTWNSDEIVASMTIGAPAAREGGDWRLRVAKLSRIFAQNCVRHRDPTGTQSASTAEALDAIHSSFTNAAIVRIVCPGVLQVISSPLGSSPQQSSGRGRVLEALQRLLRQRSECGIGMRQNPGLPFQIVNQRTNRRISVGR